MQFSQERLNVWMYKFLLGSLPDRQVELLKKELERREKENQISSALERKILASFSAINPRKYLVDLINDWGKRNWGD